jgi:hypothetical protein
MNGQGGDANTPMRIRCDVPYSTGTGTGTGMPLHVSVVVITAL